MTSGRRGWSGEPRRLWTLDRDFEHIVDVLETLEVRVFESC